jgi:hypothetical protein
MLFPLPYRSVKYGLSDAVMARHRPGEINYKLARQNVLHAFRSGAISQLQICDAQTELTRNANYCGVALEELCPVCAAESLRNVTYVFGPRLPSGGRCISNLAEMNRLARRDATYTAYVVEVCVDCGWNHLIRSFLLS